MFGDLGTTTTATTTYNNVSAVVEGVVNYHFGENKAYVGPASGLWDSSTANHFTPAWC